MDLASFCSQLQTKLSPDVYRGGATSRASPFALLLKHMNWVALGRYALGVLSWEEVADKSRLIQSARQGVSSHMFTIPYLWQVGLYLVVVGPEREWSPFIEEMTADKTGFHSVIIQAIHFIDLDEGENHVNRSEWGPIQFGGTVSVTEIINSVAEQDRAVRFFPAQ